MNVPESFSVVGVEVVGVPRVGVVSLLFLDHLFRVLSRICNVMLRSKTQFALLSPPSLNSQGFGHRAVMFSYGSDCYLVTLV